LQIEEPGEIGVVETRRDLGGDPRLRMKGDAEAGGGQHRQIVGAVADGECRRRRETMAGGEREQNVALPFAGDDRRRHGAGDAAVIEREPMGENIVEAERPSDALGEDREAARDECRRRAVPAHRRDQLARPRVQPDAGGGPLEDPAIGAGEKLDPFLERRGEVDLAVHRPSRDLRDARPQCQELGEFVQHLVLDDRRFEVGDEEAPLAPGGRLQHEVDRGTAEDGARRRRERSRLGRRSRRLEGEIAGFAGSQPDRRRRTRQDGADRGGGVGQRGSARGAGDEGEDALHRPIPYAPLRHRRNRWRRWAGSPASALLALALAACLPQLPPDTAAEAEAAGLVGKHFWEVVSFPLAATCRAPVSVTCSATGQGFTVEEATLGTGGMVFVRVRLDDGSEAYLPYVVGTSRIAWSSENPASAERVRQTQLEAITAELARMQQEYCTGDRPLRIGMSEREAMRAWCFPDHTTSTETVKGTRDEWVYKERGTLTFKDGRLIEIRRAD
jgi:hypothetical protein